MRNVMREFDGYSMRGKTTEDDTILWKWLSQYSDESDGLHVDETNMLWYGSDRYICDVIDVGCGNGILCD